MTIERVYTFLGKQIPFTAREKQSGHEDHFIDSTLLHTLALNPDIFPTRQIQILNTDHVCVRYRHGFDRLGKISLMKDEINEDRELVSSQSIFGFQRVYQYRPNR